MTTPAVIPANHWRHLFDITGHATQMREGAEPILQLKDRIAYQGTVYEPGLYIAGPEVTPPQTQPDPVYLGDAVYASFDGTYIWLHLNSHDSEPLIALEASVCDNLVAYCDKVFGERT